MSHLMIVDDDKQSANALVSLLSQQGHSVDYAESAGEALRHLKRMPPDLILLDIEMPGSDGLTLLDALASEPQYAGLKVAIYSGRDDEQTLKEAKRIGACDYVVKGQPWEELYARIQACLHGDA